jgi:hypothetical protein
LPCRRSVSSVQYNALCRTASSPVSQRYCAVWIPCTFRPYRDCASPTRPVRACTSIESLAFLSPACSLSTCLPRSGSSRTTQLPPKSVLGRTTRSLFLWPFFYLSVQSASTLGFSRSSHCSTGCPIHFSVHFFRNNAGVSEIRRCRRPRVRNCIRIVVQASCICIAIPVRSCHA